MSNEFIAGSLEHIGYVSMVVKYNEKFVFSYHRKSEKWDHIGGHVEKGETPLAAAKRELFEETGAIDFDIVPVFDCETFKQDGTLHNNTRKYFVKVREFTNLPDGSEMDKIGFFDEIPVDFRYEGNRAERTANLKRIEKYASAY